MDLIQIAKVDNVQLLSRGTPTPGALHLTAHHLIFSSHVSENDRPREVWVCYPMIHTVERRQPLGLGVEGCALRFRCRDFNFFTLNFRNDQDGKDVFDSVQKLTCVASVNQLYAFFYQPGKAEKKFNAWKIYQPEKEFARMGLGTKTDEWRLSYINKDYSLCPTYPAVLAVPAKISDNVLGYAAKFRSKSRLPALTYIHGLNQATITRCSQPLVGIKQSRSIQDEKLLTAVFETTHPKDVISTTPSNLIVDSRPLVNATAQIALGAGSENMENYKSAKKIYVPIENIHVMRESINKVVEALRDGDASPFAPNRDSLARSNWLKHLSTILEGTAQIVQTVHVNHSHVVLHCSDGWDRTSQLSALSQLCLDPFYRTLEGFMILVEKDFLSFGHMFATRSGHLSNEKFFIDKYIQPTPQLVSDSPPSSGRSSPAIGSSLPSNIVNSTPSPSQSTAAAARGAFSSIVSRISQKPSNSKPHQVKETSPVFHQFLDAVYQLLYVQSNRFEFNERFLRRLLYHAYSCQYGSFLYDSERERVEAKVRKRTHCVWDYFLARRKEFLNPEYDTSLDVGEGVLFPRGDNIRWWAQAWGRTDQEMNGSGRGTNFREETVKVKDEQPREDIQDRLTRIVRTTSPRKELSIFDGVGASPARSGEKSPVDDSPVERMTFRRQEILEATKEAFVEVDPTAGDIDPVNDDTREAVVVDEPNATTMESSDDVSIISSAMEDNGMASTDFVQDISSVELDPLGGGVEMSSLSLNGKRILNR